ATMESGDLSGISAGVRLGTDYHISPALKASISASARHWAYTPKPFASALSIGVGLSIDLTELLSPDTNIDVEKYEQEPVFPVFYSWYDENHFAKVRVQNREANDITEVRTYFYLEQYMSQPKLCASVRTLKKGESVELPLKAFFNESMLSLTERVNAPARVIVEYKSLGSTRRVEVPVDVPVYHRNAMNWQDDRRAAAFVSARDPAAMWFARYVSSVVKDRFRQGVNSNVQYAAGMFEALNAFGLNYVIDPTSAYADNIGSSSIDFLQFPHQTLMYRGGDCDDISILYCSLLEAVGIDTAFVTIPGHIFMAFSSGMSEEEARQTYYDPSQLIFYQGMAWVPVEITLTKEGFSKAWRIGAKQWRDAASRGDARIYPMKDSWTVYHPVSVPGAVSRFNLPADEKTALAFDTSLDAVVEREIRDQIRDHEAAIARSDTGNTRNRLGVLYGRYGMLAAAREQFAIAAKKGSTHARVNLANVYFLEQNYRDALTEYNRVLASDSANSLALLGAARCYYELDEFNRADTLYAELGTRDAALTRNYAYLGSFFETRGRAWSLADRLVTTTWSMPPISEGPQPRKQAYVGYALTELPDEAPRIERADSGLMSALSVAPAASSEDIFDFDRETEAGREAVLPGKNDAATLRALERQLAGTTSGDDDPDESLDATPVMATSVTEEPIAPGLGAGADDPEVERALSLAAAPALAAAPVPKVVATPAAQAVVADTVTPVAGGVAEPKVIAEPEPVA
ncbi:MAG TPA: tetratricopeptide repeat protein, partial [Treponemataceae bacterium]|nr:tetratricopeptide repeat protein [Treponemataceae bacterium]